MEFAEITNYLIDTHAHLDFPEFAGDIPSTLSRAHEAGVHTIITIGIDIRSSRRAAEIAAQYDEVYATAGIHPHDSFIPDESSMKELETIAREDLVLAIGEIGLDYFRDKQPRHVQQECLRQQLELARLLGKPAVFHVRDAWQDFFIIAEEYAPSLSGAIMHCFSGDWDTAARCLDMGFFLSIPGVVTFSKAADLQDVVRRAPLDRLLVETDAPYLAPVPFRGKTNEPAYVRHTAEKIAQLRNEPFAKIAEHTTRNARSVFGIS
ncbi:MAG: TatD family hydrolase [Syntrophobacteraceae bacterium]